MTVNEFIHKVKYEIMLSSLDIPLLCNGKSIKEMEIIILANGKRYFNLYGN